MEKDRLGVTGGMVPGGCCAKYFSNRVVSSGFQGAVQIWNYVEVVVLYLVFMQYKYVAYIIY